MIRTGWRQAVAWVVLWASLDIAIFALLPGEQSWWVELLVIVGAGLASALVVELMRRRTDHA